MQEQQQGHYFPRRGYLHSVCLILGVSLACSVSAAQMSAREVMEAVDQLADGDTRAAQYTMVLIDRRERQRSRELTILSKDYGQDTRTLSTFNSPADIRGTAYLNYDWDDAERDDDSWLYLPAMQRVRRIASSDTSDSFLGSDFTYADINGLEIDWYDYRFVNESETVDGVECWVIEATPRAAMKEKAEQATGYSRLQAWISKDNFVQMRAQAWELRGNRVKYFTASDIRQVDGIWTVHRQQAVTTRNGRQEHASILQLNDIRYDINIDDDALTTEAMQRGID
jgi:hypothetical protein